MRNFRLILYLFLVFVFIAFLVKLGFQLLFWFLDRWYITIPLIIGIYLLQYLPKKRSKKNERIILDPSKEIKLDSEPIIRNLDDNE